ncbi:MAG: hypothetical protein NVSMB25_03210 [Thermoleophilaceae bacterium]
MYVEVERLARVCGRKAARLESGSLPAAQARLVEQEAEPAADVEQPAGWSVALDLVEDAAGGGALTRLLFEIVV